MACSTTLASQGLSPAMLNIESSVIVCSTIVVLDGAGRNGTALAAKPQPPVVDRIGTEVVKVMSDKLLNPTLTSHLAQHCSVQSAARPSCTTPCKDMIHTACPCWQAGSQERTGEWSHATNYFSLLLPCVGYEQHLWISLQDHTPFKNVMSLIFGMYNCEV